MGIGDECLEFEALDQIENKHYKMVPTKYYTQQNDSPRCLCLSRFQNWFRNCQITEQNRQFQTIKSHLKHD